VSKIVRICPTDIENALTEYIENNRIAFFSSSVLVISFFYAKPGPSPFSFRIFSISVRQAVTPN